MLKRIVIITFVLVGLTACQVKDKFVSIDSSSPKRIAVSYILTHGMCIGYLESQSAISDVQFKNLFQRDQQAKYYVLMALADPNQHNLEVAKQSVQNLIAFMQVK